MVFGAYPQQHQKRSGSPERPLLDEVDPSPETSEDLEYDAKSPFLSPYERKSRRSRCLSLLTILIINVGVFVIAFQFFLLWNLWQNQSHLEVLGEINGLVPSGKISTEKRSISATHFVIAVGTEPRIFAPDPMFDPLNASDPGWDRVMPSKPMIFISPTQHEDGELIQ